jgi:hypothetical protein
METGSNRTSSNIANLSSPFRTVILVCFVAALFYLAAKLGGLLIISTQLSWPLWLGNVLLVSILLLVPRRMWPILVAAAFAAFILYDLQAGLTTRQRVEIYSGGFLNFEPDRPVARWPLHIPKRIHPSDR